MEGMIKYFFFPYLCFFFPLKICKVLTCIWEMKDELNYFGTHMLMKLGLG